MTTTSTPPRVGELWPEQGGTYAGIMRGDDGTLYHLIVSGEEGDFSDLAWGGYGKRQTGASSTWDGKANTQALNAAAPEHPAADKVATTEVDGRGDWYLPAQRELALCWATVPHLFQKDWYWSSTQYSAVGAWIQGVDDGYQYLLGGKGNEYRARAVRRLVIE